MLLVLSFLSGARHCRSPSGSRFFELLEFHNKFLVELLYSEKVLSFSCMIYLFGKIVVACFHATQILGKTHNFLFVL